MSDHSTSDYSCYEESSRDAYLRHDITTEQELSVDDFATLILGCEDWNDFVNSKEISDISKDREFQACLSGYNDVVEEVDLFPRFCDLANRVIGTGLRSVDETARFHFLRINPSANTGPYAARKPQVIVVDRGAGSNRETGGSRISTVLWKDVLGYVEFKLEADEDEWATAYGYSSGSESEGGGQPSSGERVSGSSNKRRRGEESSEPPTKRCRMKGSEIEAKVRCAGYALNMLSSCAGVRTHTLGLYIDRDNISLHFFDRSVFVSSKLFSLKTDPQTLVALLLVLRGLDDGKWGFVLGFDRQNPIILRLKDGWQLEFSGIISQKRSLIGRGTVVIRGHLTKVPDADQRRAVAIKVSSPPRTRQSERDILQCAYNKATGKSERMLDHLPKIYHCEDVELGVNARLSVFSDAGAYEARVLRIIAFRELRPIYELIAVGELATVFRDVFNCCRWLYEEANILHRDISLHNIMYYHKDGNVCGVLNDFDFATVVGDTSPAAEKQQIGTAAFMSYELLICNDTPHLYRHDLESLFYVLVILTSHYENGKEVKKPPLKSWFALGPCRYLGAIKCGTLVARELPRTTPGYAVFKKWLDPMEEMFREEMLADDSWGKETLGGIVTFDRMAGILSIRLESE